MLLDEEANAALVRVLSPLLPLARFLKLPVLDFDVYTERLDARQTAAAVRPSIVSFFELVCSWFVRCRPGGHVSWA